MNSILGSEGVVALQQLAARRTLFAFDFDGTLARTEVDPGQAQPSRRVSRLARLIGRHADMAVVSGRSVSDLAQRLGFCPRWLSGNHGVEIAELATAGADAQYRAAADVKLLDDARNSCAQWARDLKAAMPMHPVQRGVWLEDKTYSLCVHYRLAADRALASVAIYKAVSALSPRPRIVQGNLAINLLSEGAPDKASALRNISELGTYETVLFVGDEETDEIVFRSAPPNWVTVRVAGGADSAARFALQSQNEIEDLLDAIRRAIEADSPAVSAHHGKTPNRPHDWIRGQS